MASCKTELCIPAASSPAQEVMRSPVSEGKISTGLIPSRRHKSNYRRSSGSWGSFLTSGSLQPFCFSLPPKAKYDARVHRGAVCKWRAGARSPLRCQLAAPCKQYAWHTIFRTGAASSLSEGLRQAVRPGYSDNPKRFHFRVSYFHGCCLDDDRSKELVAYMVGF